MIDRYGVVDWLMHGDPASQYQVKRDLLNASEIELTALRARIAEEGWGRAYHIDWTK